MSDLREKLGLRRRRAEDWEKVATHGELAIVRELEGRDDPGSARMLQRYRAKLIRRSVLRGPAPRRQRPVRSWLLHIGEVAIKLAFDPTTTQPEQTGEHRRWARVSVPVEPARKADAVAKAATETHVPEAPVRQVPLLPRSGTTPITNPRAWVSQRTRSSWSLSKGLEGEQW